jgi:hypothetical protein
MAHLLIHSIENLLKKYGNILHLVIHHFLSDLHQTQIINIIALFTLKMNLHDNLSECFVSVKGMEVILFEADFIHVLLDLLVQFLEQ